MVNAPVDSPVLLVGGGGHARVCLDLLMRQGIHVMGYIAKESSSLIQAIPYLGEDDRVLSFAPNEVRLVMGIGYLVDSSLREELFNRYKKRGYEFATLIHDSAIVSATANVGEGAQIMAGAVVQTNAVIGENVLVNTRASIDHDSHIGNHAAVMPGTTICGNVHVAERVFVGAGTTIIPNLSIGERTVIGAGSVVVNHLPAHSFVYGVPAMARDRGKRT